MKAKDRTWTYMFRGWWWWALDIRRALFEVWCLGGVVQVGG